MIFCQINVDTLENKKTENKYRKAFSFMFSFVNIFRSLENRDDSLWIAQVLSSIHPPIPADPLIMVLPSAETHRN